MVDFDSNLVLAIIIYLCACYILFNYKHSKMFDENGDFKSFGLNKDETVFPYWLVTTLIGLSSYYFLVIRNNHI
tara:strand:- start:62 stop:283 length:222 start_codon:yes stop_codon:yes gene_type:complete